MKLKSIAIILLFQTTLTIHAQTTPNGQIYADIFRYKTSIQKEGLIERYQANFLLQQYRKQIQGGGQLTKEQFEEIKSSAAKYRQELKTTFRESEFDFSGSDGIGYKVIRNTVKSSVAKLAGTVKSTGIGIVAEPVATGIAELGFELYESHRNLNLAIDSGERFSRDLKFSDITIIELHKASVLDPRLKKLIDMNFSTLMKGSILDTPEQLYSSNADLAQFVGLANGLAINSEQAKVRFEILRKKLINGFSKNASELTVSSFEKKWDRWQQTQAAQKTQEDTIQSIKQDAAEQRLMVSALVQLGTIAKIDPKTLHAVDVLSNVAINAAELSHLAGLVGGVSDLALTGNILSMAASVAGLFGSQGPSVEQVILEQIVALRKQIEELRQIVVEGFQSIDQRLIDVLDNQTQHFLAIERDLSFTKVAVEDLQSVLDSFVKSSSERAKYEVLKQYREKMKSCLPEKYQFALATVPKSLRPDELGECLEYSMDFGLIGRTQFNTSDVKSVKDSGPSILAEFPNESWLQFLGSYFKNNYGRKQLSEYLEANASDQSEFKQLNGLGRALPLVANESWSRAVDDVVLLANKSKVDPYYFKTLYNSGVSYRNYVSSLVSSPVAAGQFQLDSKLIKELMDDYRDKAGRYVDAALSLVNQSVKNSFEPAKGIDQGFNELGEFDYRSNRFVGLCKGASGISLSIVPRRFSVKNANEVESGVALIEAEYAKPSAYEPLKQFEVGKMNVDQTLWKLVKLPKQYKMAMALGSADLESCVQSIHFANVSMVDLTRLYVHNQTQGKRDYKIEARIESRVKESRLDISPQVTIEFRVVFKGDPLHQIDTRSFLVSRTQINLRKVFAINGKKLNDIFLSSWNSIGKDTWNQTWGRVATEKASPQERGASQRSLEKFLLSELPIRVKSVLAEPSGEVQKKLDDATNAYSVLYSGIFLGAYPLWSGNLDDGSKTFALGELFKGRDGIPSPENLLSFALHGETREKYYARLDSKIAAAKKIVEKVAVQPYTPFYPYIEKRLLILEALSILGDGNQP